MLIRVNKYYSVVIYKKIKIGDNFMEEYICKLATIEEMEENWDYLIKIHPDEVNLSPKLLRGGDK